MPWKSSGRGVWVTSGSPDAVGGCEDVVGGDQGAATRVPPRVILEVLEGDLGEDVKGACVSPQGPTPHAPLHPASHPRGGKLTCQGQLWGMASSPPTTRADRLGWKMGTPQLEAGGDRRGRAQVRVPGVSLGKGQVERAHI